MSILDEIRKFFDEEGFKEISVNEYRNIVIRHRPKDFLDLLNNLSEAIDNIGGFEFVQKFYNLSAKKIGNLAIQDIHDSPFRKGKEFCLERIIRDSNLKQGDYILDVCCGTGLEDSFLANYVGGVGYVVGVDISRNILDVAKERSKKRKLKNIDFIRAEKDHLPFKEGVFDHVICIDSFGEGDIKIDNYYEVFYRRLSGFKRVLKNNDNSTVSINSSSEHMLTVNNPQDLKKRYDFYKSLLNFVRLIYSVGLGNEIISIKDLKVPDGYRYLYAIYTAKH